MGLSEPDNQGAAPVTIRSVSLTNAVGMGSTDDAWLVPVNANGPQLGLGQAYPPATYPLWPRRVPAVGAVIQPGQRQQLVFGVYRTTAADATSDGPTVVYTAGHASYTLHEGFSLALARARCFLSSLP